ncbi:hypothetical protein EGH21_07115 [Halomicroarcula sp. F13]|uniref:Uncharacterized protein n=1 Tax=Haloarcula rubra TaxID=2487747 RepID=A0AAW4PQX9_9EURY|nr:hypothetical protein [Halomicroarcula rubra]MBX0322798.1 hypothetical protein [Halomicroarcula rubra]
MTDESRAVLKNDLLVGLAVLAVAFFSDGVAAVTAVPAVTVAMAGLLAVALYVVEHDAVPGLFPEVVALASLVLLVSVAAGMAVLLPHPVAVVATAALVGFGVGLVGYRTVYGLLRPVPQYRLDRQR